MKGTTTMMPRLTALAAAAALLCAGALAALPADAAEKPAFGKIPAKGVTLKRKAGYWTECRYSGLGTICETVYARAKNGKFRKLAAKAGKVTTQNGYVQICYDGSNNATICYWVYTRVKTSK
jgi:invasion protein IalB